MHLARAAASASALRHSISLRRVSCRVSYMAVTAPKIAVAIATAAATVSSSAAPGFPSIPQASPGAAGMVTAAVPPAAIHRRFVLRSVMSAGRLAGLFARAGCGSLEPGCATTCCKAHEGASGGQNRPLRSYSHHLVARPRSPPVEKADEDEKKLDTGRGV